MRKAKAVTLYRALLGLAAAILLATAGLHSTGLVDVGEILAQSGVSTEWQSVFQGLWLMFSIHLAVVAVLLVVLGRWPAARPVLAAATAMPIADTILLLAVVGVFAGSIMTGLAAVLCLGALAVSPAGAGSAAPG